jgi:hypothetical protein
VNGNTILRETIISFRHSQCEEVITLGPVNRVVTQITKCPITGKKILSIEKISKVEFTLEVKWDIEVHGVVLPFIFVIKNHISKGTVNAIDRTASEGKIRFKKTNKT